MTLRTFSYGGGVQSTAALVLAAQGKIDFKTFLFANVGDDSEHPDTLKYVREVAMPFAAEQGIDLQELHRVRRDGRTETLLERLERPGSRSLPIPVRMPDTGAPGTRSCTADFKIRVIGKWFREHGATKTDPGHVGIGISTDEIERAHPGLDPKMLYQFREYPLLDLGMDRLACQNTIAAAGLPVPGKSACWFCPFHTPARFQTMRHDEPVLFWKAVGLENLLNERRDMLGRDHVYLTRFGRPLDRVTSPDEQLSLGLDGGTGDDCESGYCMT